jgi:serine/threonine protein kinase/WD40 repeat protein
MSDSASAPHPDDEILAQIMLERERAGSQGVDLDAYVSRYPHLAREIRELFQVQEALASSRPETDVPQPQRLGEFQIIRRIGRGGMGEIYEAVQEPLNRKVAVKVIRHGRISPLTRERFLREQGVLARLHQTHIVPIHTAGEEGPLQYFAMPYIEGAALHHVVRTVRQLETSQPHSKTPSLAKLAGMVADSRDVPTGPEVGAGPDGSSGGSAQKENAALSSSPSSSTRAAKLMLSLEYFRSVAEVMADAAEALHHAHGVHILHRDVKPSNIMVDTSGQCWIIDFGLAGYLNGQDATRPQQEAAALGPEPASVSGIMGTPQYMAPEQFEGKADARTDVWGLGVSLYELLTLRRAFDDLLDTQVRTKIRTEGPTPPQELVRNIPADLVAICRKAMRKEPGQRYQTAKEVAEDLRRWMRLEPTTARPARTPRRVFLWARRNKGWAAAIIMILFAFSALAVGAFLVEKSRAEGAQYALELQELQQLRLSTHTAGWSEEAWERVRKLAKIRKDDNLRNQAAATLVGIDAKISKTFPFDASSVVFDRAGKRLLMGGYTDYKGGQFNPVEPARLWNGGIDDPHPSKKNGSGPVAFHSDGTPLQLVADPEDRFHLLLWDVGKQELVREFRIAPKAATLESYSLHSLILALSADGSRVAASTLLPDGKGMLLVWDAHSGEQLHEVPKKFTGLAFSPDSALLAGGDENGEITLWSLKPAKELTTLSAGRTAIYGLAFTRDTRRREGKQREEESWLLAAGGNGGTVTIWDLQAKVFKSQFRGSPFDVYAVAFNPDGTILASAGRSEAKLWNASTGRLLLNLADRHWMTGLAFSGDGKRLAVSSRGVFGRQGVVDVWELDYGRGMQTLRGLANRIEQISISPDGRFLAALSDDWQVAIWELATGQLKHIFDAPKGYYSDNAALAFSHDGKRFAFATKTKAVLWDVEKGTIIGKPWEDLPPAFGDRLAFDPTGKKLFLIRAETEGRKFPPSDNVDYKKHPRVCRIRDLLSPEPMEALVEITEFKRDVFIWAVAPDASYFVVEGIADAAKPLWRTVKAVDTATGKKELLSIAAPVPTDGHHLAARIDPTGKTVSVAFQHQPTGLFEMPSGKPAGSLGQSPQNLSPETKYWLSSPAISLYRRQDESPLVTLDIDGMHSNQPLFNAAGSHVAWGNRDGTVTVCDLKEIQQRLAEVGLGW